jgi:AmmeMemoRadiSam system protein B
MARVGRLLPALRRNLDIQPSPVTDRPGLLLRDPFQYAEGMLVIPPALVPLLRRFDGRGDEGDLKAELVRATGDIRAGQVVDHLLEHLGRGFLDDETFRGRRVERHRAFAAQEVRSPAHAGEAYPAEREALQATLRGYLEGAARPASPPAPRLMAIAAPHVSPAGGFSSYAAAYAALAGGPADATYLVLGTSHFGAPDRFGLTRKPFATPLGTAPPDLALVDRLVETGGPAVELEDYCHAVEHSIEFQVVFLQHVLGPAVRIVPVLCGPFTGGGETGLPEEEEGVDRFLRALADLVRHEGARLVFVLGVDMAHVGRRYGDDFAARAGKGRLAEVERFDRERCARVVCGDAEGFWALVRQGGDELRWCGASPFYTFLRAAAPPVGELLAYEQWNIDEESVVSFAGMAFPRASEEGT